MALSSSGYITLGDNIAGRSVAKELNDGPPNFRNTISLGDSNVRALAQRTSGSISMSHLRGKSAALDTQTVTVGVVQASAYLPAVYGFYNLSSTSNIGSCSDGTCNFKSGVAYRRLQWSSQGLLFELAGVQSNSGWTTMTVGGLSLSRSSATFITLGTSGSRWSWTGQSNPFGTTAGATKVVTFT